MVTFDAPSQPVVGRNHVLGHSESTTFKLRRYFWNVDSLIMYRVDLPMKKDHTHSSHRITKIIVAVY